MKFLKRVAKRTVSSIEAVLDRVFCVVGAVLFSQAPEFIQQYLQRLGGHLDEARHLLGQYENIARQAGLSLGDFITRTASNADAVVAKHAGVMEDATARVTDLAAAQAAIRDASIYARPYEFLRHIDREIAANTWAAFKPAVPSTLEGLLYAAAGMLVLLVFYYACIHFPVALLWRRRRNRKAAARAALQQPGQPPNPEPAPPEPEGRPPEPETPADRPPGTGESSESLKT